MPQKDLLMPWRTVLDNVALGLEMDGVPRREARERARAELPRFGLTGFERRWPGNLSGGMRQRAALLRTFLAGRDVMLLDEPLGALDSLTRQAMREWLLDVWQADRKSILFVTHDVEEAVYLSDRVYVMSGRPGRMEVERRRAAASPAHVRDDLVPGVPGAEDAAADAAARGGGAAARCARSGRLMREFAGRVLPPLIFALLVLVLWQLLVGVTGIKESSLPTPTQVAQALWDDRALLWDSAWVTIREIALGYAAAILLGVGLAAAIVMSRTVERAVYPWLVTSQLVPIPAIAPIIVIWTGFDMRPKVIVIALVSFFPIAVNTIDGLKSTDPDLLNLLRTLGARRWRRFRAAQFPSALPSLFTGLRIAAALAVIGAVFAEWVGSSEGLGYLILTFNNQTATTEMFAAVVVLAIIGIALFALVGLCERLAIPWHHEPRREDAAAREGE